MPLRQRNLSVTLFLISQEHLEGISEKANVYVT